MVVYIGISKVEALQPTGVFSIPSMVCGCSIYMLAQLLLPHLPTVSNPAPDSSLYRAAAPRLRLLKLLLPFASALAAAPQLRPLQLLLAACIRFSWCSRLCALQLLPDCVRFGCCSPIASASTAAPRLRLLQLLLPDCARFNCCFPIACIRL